MQRLIGNPIIDEKKGGESRWRIKNRHPAELLVQLQKLCEAVLHQRLLNQQLDQLLHNRVAVVAKRNEMSHKLR
jgi:hypothetical protein